MILHEVSIPNALFFNLVILSVAVFDVTFDSNLFIYMYNSHILN